MTEGSRRDRNFCVVEGTGKRTWTWYRNSWWTNDNNKRFWISV